MYTAHSKDMTQFLMSTDTYKITSDSGVNVCKKFKFFSQFSQNF